MGPIDYTSQLPQIDLAQKFTAGLQAGAAVGQLDQQQQARALALQQAQQYNIEARAALANPTPQAFAALAIKYPAQREAVKQSWDGLSAADQKAEGDTMAQAYSALLADKPEIAKQVVQAQIDARKNSGLDTSHYDNALSMLNTDPNKAKGALGFTLSHINDPKAFASQFGALGGEQRAQEQAPAELASKKAGAVRATAEATVAAGTVPALIAKPALQNDETRSQIADRTKRFALDQDKFETETKIKLTELKQKFGELPAPIVKDQSDAVTEAIAAQQSSQRMTGLADRIDAAAAELGSGAKAKAGELWKKTFGSQNDLTRIRAEYNRIVTPAAMAAYKQVASGSTSDKDIETAMLGVPADTADPSTMAQFLRGTAKLQQYSAVLNNAKSEWLGEVKGLGKAKGDIEIDGIKVASGTTFKQFTDAYVEKKIKLLDTASLQSRPYMKYAAPATPQSGGASGNY